MTYTPIILKESVNDNTIGKTLTLLFLGCEAKPPYGPYEHTANLFLQLLVRALQSCGATKTTHIQLEVYSTSQGNFPTADALRDCDGVILPGSFNSAYDEDEWVLTLKRWIQSELVAQQIPTLGVCFGHQLYAHSFEQGQATKCGAGPQAGRKSSHLTEDGKKWLFPAGDGGGGGGNDPSSNGLLHLYYTHGDMVEKLPPHASKLSGNDKVPIQSAIYFANVNNDDDDDNDDVNTNNTTTTPQNTKPIAITFQAHPEFAGQRELGMEQTLQDIMALMQSRGDVSKDDYEHSREDAKEQFETVEKDSIGVMVAVGKTFGWF